MSYDPDEMMLELFRAEVESHSDSLTRSLLKLEQDPDSTVVLDGLMRAAHSIKGAARIVRVDAAADVAHVMEDCFVAAQRGELVLESSGIDVLLQAVDLLGKISEESKGSNVDWSRFDASIAITVEKLRCVLKKQPIPSHLLEAKLVLPSPALMEKNIPAQNGVFSNSMPLQSESVSESVAPPDSIEVGDKSLVQTLVLPELLDASNAESYRLALLNMWERSSSVVLDLSQLKDLDSIGLAWLHSASKFASAHSRELRMRHASEDIDAMLNWIKLSSRTES